jgi:prophage antirepressor-like protein
MMALAKAAASHSEAFQYGFENNERLVLNNEEVTVLFFAAAPDEPWFKAKPVHLAFGAKNISQTLARVHADDKASLKDLVQQKGKPVKTVTSHMKPLLDEDNNYNEGRAYYVNESGLYKILLGSGKPQAQRFQRWVTSEVLPSIRRTVSFSIGHSSGATTGGGCVGIISSSSHEEAPPARRRRVSQRVAESPPPAPDSEASSPIAIFEFVRSHAELEGASLRRYVKFAASHFLDLAACEHPEMTEGELRRRYSFSGLGLNAEVPAQELYLLQAAWAATVMAAHHDGVGTLNVHAAAAEDSVNREFVTLLRQRGALNDGSSGGAIGFLDHWTASAGPILRTSTALLRAGVPPTQLHCANPDIGIITRLRELGIVTHHGCWEEALGSWPPFIGVYLDRCTGSAAMLLEEVQALEGHCLPGCIMGLTICQREFDEESMVRRVGRLIECLTQRSWCFARDTFDESLLEHCNSAGKTVITLFWQLPISVW